jgi:hypothetical protein
VRAIQVLRDLVENRQEELGEVAARLLADGMPLLIVPKSQKQSLGFTTHAAPYCFKFCNLWLVGFTVEMTTALRLAMCKLFAVPADLNYPCRTCSVVEPTLTCFVMDMERGCEAMAVFDHRTPNLMLLLTHCWANVVPNEMVKMLAVNPPFAEGPQIFVRLDRMAYGLSSKCRHASGPITAEVAYEKQLAGRCITRTERLPHFLLVVNAHIAQPQKRPPTQHAGKHMQFIITMP